MSDEPTKYVLRKDVEATRHDDGDKQGAYWIVDIPMDDQGGIWEKDFKDWFVPVSDLSRENQPRQQLHKSHIADEISGALAQGFDPTDAVWKLLEESGLV